MGQLGDDAVGQRKLVEIVFRVAGEIFERQHRDGLFVFAPPARRSGRGWARRVVAPSRLFGCGTSSPAGPTLACRMTIAKLIEDAAAKDPAQGPGEPPRTARAARRNQDRAAADWLDAQILRKL